MQQQWINMLATEASEEKARVLQRFFKTGPGEYGEGDIFIGVTVPAIRKVANYFADAPLTVIDYMLAEPIHEHRLSALLALVERYRRHKKSPEYCREIVEYYLSRTEVINNWDLVDLSAPKILGEWMLYHPEPALLDSMSRSGDLWRERIAIVSTLTLIRSGKYDEMLRLAKRYLTHPHPLIHKATGWMLREAGKRDENVLRTFLDHYADRMPRTMLRYAIERLDHESRTRYMAAGRKAKTKI